MLLGKIPIDIMSLRIYFFDRYCRTCIRNGTQDERRCSKLSGHAPLCCKTQDAFIRRHRKKVNEQAVTEIINELNRSVEKKDNGSFSEFV